MRTVLQGMAPSQKSVVTYGTITQDSVSLTWGCKSRGDNGDCMSLAVSVAGNLTSPAGD